MGGGRIRSWYWLVVGLLLAARMVAAGDLADKAAAYDALVPLRHLPHDTIFDPIFTAPGSTTIAGYSDFGDSAIWTGHYLASQAYRYAVTHSPVALDNARRALTGITRLVAVAGNQGYLARAAVPVGSPWAAQFIGSNPIVTLPAPVHPRIHPPEAGHVFYKSTVGGVAYYWEGTISRDQYSGVMYGMSIAWDLLPLPDVRAKIASNVTKIVSFLEGHGWTPISPDGEIATTFLGRSEQILAFLQIARQVNPGAFAAAYNARAKQLWKTVWIAPFTETFDVYGSYYKFNLDHINLFNLIRLEPDPSRRSTYGKALSQWLRPPLASHGNVHFDYIYEAALGLHDAGILAYDLSALALFPAAPRLDLAVVNSTDPTIARAWLHPELADQALPVNRRPPSDFLWQRGPFNLDGGGDGSRAYPGIDYLLPYWMGRYYGFLPAGS